MKTLTSYINETLTSKVRKKVIDNYPKMIAYIDSSMSNDKKAEALKYGMEFFLKDPTHEIVAGCTTYDVTVAVIDKALESLGIYDGDGSIAGDIDDPNSYCGIFNAIAKAACPRYDIWKEE